MRRKKILVWLRNDLRLHDNTTIERAAAKADEIYFCYCLDEKLYSATPLGFDAMGPFRRKFLHESLIELKKNLIENGSDLIVVKGDVSKEIASVAKQLQVDSVYYSKEVCPFEEQQENELHALLHSEKIDWESFWTSTLTDKDKLPFTIHSLPDVFTKFRNKVERENILRQPELLSIREEMIRTDLDFPGVRNTMIEEVNLKSLLPRIDADERGVLEFRGGERAAIERLHAYLWETDAIATYKETRNGLVGANYSSKFSPWLAIGCLSPALIYKEICDYEEERVQNESTYWMIFELLWRDFFRFTAFKQKSLLFKLNGFNGNGTKKWRRDKRTLDAWINGHTGDAFVDANMIELKQTGWMSNRGRQNVASYFVHDLGMDWRWGASYFESQLIDYDPASNWGNWAYIAGVGNDPRPDRKFNTQKQANDYDKQGAFRSLWLKNSFA